MVSDSPHLVSRKRKRRRREDKSALSARLYLDNSLHGESGILSEDLYHDLFPYAHAQDVSTFYVAVTAWTPAASSAESTWTILPFRTITKDDKPLTPSTLRFPAAAQSTQSFVNLVQTISPNRTLRQNVSIEVRVNDVVPLALETIIVSVDAHAIERLEEVQKRYGSGFGHTNGYAHRSAGKRAQTQEQAGSNVASPQDARKRLVRDALQRSNVVHVGDLLPLALTHPVTHAIAPPGKVLACLPVAQGLIVSTTKIVITFASDRRPPNARSRSLLSPRLPEESDEEADATTEAFYSAAEDNYLSPAKPIVVSKSATDMSNSEDMLDSSAQESDLSDDSDDMIPLSAPALLEPASGIGSAFTGATPRPFGSRINGIATPGSVYSSMTATTMRGGQAVRTKIYRAQGLLSRISRDLLHPRPSADEDDEARVYVDNATLVRLGCFSGDWVKIEATENQLLQQLNAFAQLDSLTIPTWRPVKVYSLPENLSKRQPRYPVNSRSGQKDNQSSLPNNPSSLPILYASPILLANLKEPQNVSLSPLQNTRKQGPKRPLGQRAGGPISNVPPTASEVTLRKIVTPLANDRSLNNILYANLKGYFERRQRIVKAGDLIAVSIDEFLGRSLYAGSSEDDTNLVPLLNQSTIHSNADTGDAQNEASCANVAWFTVEAVTTPPEDVDHNDGLDGWNGTALIDPSHMMMRQSGDDRRKLPSATRSAWPIYLGLQKVPPKSSMLPSGITDRPQQYVSGLQRRLRELLSVSTSQRAIHLGIAPIAVLLTSTQRSIGKASLVERTCADLGMHYFALDAHDIASEGGAGVDVQAQGILEARFARALDCGPEFTAVCIKHIEALGSDRVAASIKGLLATCRVLVATTTDVDKIPDSVRGLFTHELEMSAPDEGEREGILRDLITTSGVSISADVDLASVAVKTAALVAGDLVDVVDRAVIAKSHRLAMLAESNSLVLGEDITTKDIQLCGGDEAFALVPADFDDAVEHARKNFADSIGAPKIPNVQWSDVGGLSNVKDAVIETIQLPLSRPELFAKGLKKRSGILFYGPPGTGKTLLAKAIATEFSLNFFSVKGPELLNMYIGESEANVRRVFQRARDARPCVVFFDELDSVAPKRGNQGDSGGVMDRIVSQLLAELDGMSDGEENGGGVFVIGATNRPDLLDQALLRPGRFDKMLYLGISDTHDKQATILQALTRKFTLDPMLSLSRVAESLPFTFTGADLYALCSDAMLKAITRSAKLVDSKLAAVNAVRASRGLGNASVAYYFDHHATEEDTQVCVSEEDFVQARSELVPSVSVDELQHYERVRAMFEGANAGKEDGKGAAAPPVISRVTSSDESNKQSKGKMPMTNGKMTSRESRVYDADHDEEDDFVRRASQMTLGDGPGKGKGKGKWRPPPEEVPNASNGGGGNEDEDLYD